MKFIYTFFLSSLLLFGSLYGFIMAIDPYNKMGNNPFHLKTKAVDFARENKFNQIEHTSKKYEAFILGSSAAHRYETKVINELTGLKSYNYAVQSTTPEDYLAIVRHILSRQHPKLILIALDFFGMNKNFKTDDMFYSSPLKNYLSEVPKKDTADELINTTYLTLKALGDSFKVVWVNIAGEARHAYLEDGDHVYEPPDKGPLKITQFYYPDYTIGETRVKYLKEIRSLCDKAGVRLIVFTSPLSYDHVEMIEKDSQLKLKLDEFKSVTRSIFNEVYDFNNETVKNYNSKMYFNDSTHPTNLFSTLVLKRILGNDENLASLGKKI